MLKVHYVSMAKKDKDDKPSLQPYLCGAEERWGLWVYPSEVYPSDGIKEQLCDSCALLHALNPEDTLDYDPGRGRTRT